MQAVCLPPSSNLQLLPGRTPPLVHLKKFRMRKHRMLAPDSWGTYQWNDFKETRLLHLHIHRKALSTLTWDVWFSLINSKLLMFQLPGLCCKNSSVSWLLTYLFGTVSSSWDAMSRLNPQVCQIKDSSPLLGWAFFQSTTLWINHLMRHKNWWFLVLTESKGRGGGISETENLFIQVRSL